MNAGMQQRPQVAVERRRPLHPLLARLPPDRRTQRIVGLAIEHTRMVPVILLRAARRQARAPLGAERRHCRGRS